MNKVPIRISAIVVNDSITPYGYGETHTLKRGWTYRVDKPSTSDAKPHVHVDNNKKRDPRSRKCRWNT